jgi:hypothetical protein
MFGMDVSFFSVSVPFRKPDLPPLSSFVILNYGGQVEAETEC